MQTTPTNTVYLALYKGHRDGAWYRPGVAAARQRAIRLLLFLHPRRRRAPQNHATAARKVGFNPC